MIRSVFRYIRQRLPGREELSDPARLTRQSLALLRREYQGRPLLEKHADTNPIKQFETWFREATNVIKDDPNAMILSTVDQDNRPSSRTVLLKDFDETGFVFYTNYDSRKGRHIAANQYVSLIFYWPDLMRQVCIEGVAGKVPDSQSDAYFNSRPAGSRLSAAASPQSDVIESRGDLERKVKELEEKYPAVDKIPRPANWGGYKVSPHRIEFWQGRVNRLHDRLCYTRDRSGSSDESEWVRSRLAP
ncbi:pyridoxamine 5'-phosphate oxidase [Natronogracilivirga saccharolytica]|uniref:Pyridoxamine 5'-phosphate oxidase n=1 Tax=Natronogracilivirga saccharolytica TaxID=2812953 RepID=A0A8J7RKQ1_9BACT|nr:pyridoxamine 5'-phosphate oxidase [Natronogracilivirga saccharolytica]MBP3191434.1 pyridoxamine 5'-phosphate oxidase [Natronogracilivirga saccharolytica]